jgi:hypothetical protein
MRALGMDKNKEPIEITLGAVKAEMKKPRLAASVREQSVSDVDQSTEITGYGRLQSTLPNAEFRVEYVMKFMNQVPPRNGNIPPVFDTGCTECFIESVDKVPIPDGDYVLFFDNDGVHHVRKTSGQWVYLAIP